MVDSSARDTPTSKPSVSQGILTRIRQRYWFSGSIAKSPPHRRHHEQSNRAHGADNHRVEDRRLFVGCPAEVAEWLGEEAGRRHLDYWRQSKWKVACLIDDLDPANWPDPRFNCYIPSRCGESLDVALRKSLAWDWWSAKAADASRSWQRTHLLKLAQSRK